MTTTAITVKENQVGELQEEINTLVTKTNELIASSSVDPSVAALLQSMTVIIKLLAKQNLNVNNNNANATSNHLANSNGPAPMAAAPPPPPPIQQLPPLNAALTDDEQKDRVIMPIEINSEIQAKCKEMLEKRRKSVRIEDSSSSESSPSSDDESEVKKRPASKKNSVSDKSKTTTRTSSTRKPQPRKRSSISSRGSNDKQNGCTVS